MALIEDLSTNSTPPEDRFHEELDSLVYHIRPYSEDLFEMEYFLEKRWLQVDEHPQHSKLHIFRTNGEYLESIDGNILTGSWSILEESNTLILEKPIHGHQSNRVLYDLAFLNQDFFILRKHGARIDQEHQFLLMGREPVISGMNWEEVLDLIESRYQNNKKLIRGTMVVVALIIIYLLMTNVI